MYSTHGFLTVENEPRNVIISNGGKNTPHTYTFNGFCQKPNFFFLSLSLL